MQRLASKSNLPAPWDATEENFGDQTGMGYSKQAVSIYIFWFILGNTHKHIYIYVCKYSVMFFFWLAGFNQPHPQLSVKSDHQPK